MARARMSSPLAAALLLAVLATAVLVAHARGVDAERAGNVVAAPVAETIPTDDVWKRMAESVAGKTRRDWLADDTPTANVADGFRVCPIALTHPLPVTITGVRTDPAVVHAGDTITVSIAFTSLRTITTGRVRTTFAIGVIEQPLASNDLCAMLASSAQASHCPLAAGKHTLTHQFHIPDEAPALKYTVRVNVDDGAGVDLACFIIEVHVKP